MIRDIPRWLFLLVVTSSFTSYATAGEPQVADTWAFKQPVRPTVPVVQASAKVRTPIDAFLLNKLEGVKLTYAVPAEKQTLIRRVTFDLTGLPPTPEEITRFVNDNSPHAFEKLVDRLLASPQFGERAALNWLDTVRYAESDGYKADDARPNAWRYRDYVIQSFNSDKPYNQFVMEQLAGDELSPQSPAAMIATGFLRHYPYEFNAVNVEQKRQDMLNDITDTTATAFLGLTLGCAKCHDHKTDPITQLDYYRFQAFFAGFWPTDRPVLPADQLVALEKQRQEWEAKTAEIRKQMEQYEKPIMDKAMAKERSRFQAQYAKVLDIAPEKRTPLEKQLGMLVEKQVYSSRKFNPSQMKPTDREKWEGMSKQLTAMAKEKPTDPPAAMTMSDVGPVPPPTFLLKRGNWQKKDEEVVPGYLAVIQDQDAQVSATPSGTSGRRLALAKWIASPENPLTARVAVNRIWQQLMGRGIVATSEDFGATGERPTHPELLDWLALELVQPNTKSDTAKPWSLKHIYRLIVTSTAYRQSAIADQGRTVDPDNKLFWRMPRKRLDGEALRDAMLVVTGQLNLKAGGPSIYPEIPDELKANAGKWSVTADAKERNRRSIYVAVKRNMRYPFFTLFDSPDRSEVCARRFVTTTAPQALTLLNDQIVLDFAQILANRVKKEAGSDQDKIIDSAFLLALGRTPATEERETLRLFMNRKGDNPNAALHDLCHSLLNLNEFLYID